MPLKPSFGLSLIDGSELIVATFSRFMPRSSNRSFRRSAFFCLFWFRTDWVCIWTVKVITVITRVWVKKKTTPGTAGWSPFFPCARVPFLDPHPRRLPASFVAGGRGDLHLRHQVLRESRRTRPRSRGSSFFFFFKSYFSSFCLFFFFLFLFLFFFFFVFLL